MDLANILNVRTLNDYIAATDTIVKICPTMKTQLNMSTVLNLKRVRFLEIEYFNKCEEHGAAFVIFEHMLKQPPSKTWGLLGKELVTMLQYWLDAVRRHLISHNQHWWNFLKSLLIFVKEIKSKDPSLLSTIVEMTAEGLLDLASNSRLDEIQRHQVLLTVNECCAESSRELRSRMKDRLAGYFMKLGALLSSCGHLPTQFGILEALLRWLVGRHDPRVRETAAAAWFPTQLFRGDTVSLFLERPWRDFYQDARDFLNSHNAHNPDLVTSVVCKQLTAGGVALLNAPQSRQTWLDVNSATRSVTVILDCRVTQAPTTKYKSFDALTIGHENISSVQLYRTGPETVLAIETGEPARALSARLATTRLRPLDRALRAAFTDHYQVLLNIDAIESSPFSEPTNTVKPCPRNFSSSEDDRAAIRPRRRKHAGYIVRSRNQMSFNSPSTASTTSLAQLHDKLAALPHILYNKEAVKVSIQPELSVVREVSECEERSSILSPASRSHAGVCQRQSDSELNTNKRNFRAVSNNPPQPSLMLAATLGSNDEQILRETYDKIYKNNQEIDLLDLLVKEAFDERDSGITRDKKTQDTDVIENTPLEQHVAKKVDKVVNSKRKCTVVSNSTTDESNTEFLIDTQCYVNERKNRRATKDKPVIEESKLLDAEAVEAFFSQHIAENTSGQLVISPTLAKKINETSSEASDNVLEDLDLNKNDMMIQAEIIDCLNDIVDEVSRNIDKCTEILSKEQQEIDVLGILTNKNMNEVSPNVLKEKNKESSNTKTTAITLRLQPAKKRAPRKTKQNAKQKKDSENKVIYDSAIDEDTEFIENTNTNSPVNNISTQLIRKKRKLYSPKDDDRDPQVEIRHRKPRRSVNNDTPIATCYKQLEMERQTRSRVTRKKRASTEPLASPKTKNLNDIFDKLKEKVENEEKITQVDTKSKADLSMYNYTSDSEDDDFKKKKTEVKKRIENNQIEPKETKRSRPAKRYKYTESSCNSSTDDNCKKVKKRKVAKQTKPRTRKLKVDHSIDLIDERMREPAPDVLEMSFVKETVSKNKVPEPEPVIELAPVMEAIANETIDEPVDTTSVKSMNTRKQRRNATPQIKKDKSANSTTSKTREINTARKGKLTDKKGTVKDAVTSKDIQQHSPLPGLVVEAEKSRKDDVTASVESMMLQKFQMIYREERDLTESVETQNLILGNEEHNIACENIQEIGIKSVEAKSISTNKAEDDKVASKIVNVNENVLEPDEKDIMETVVLSDAHSEKTILTDGKSPITGHNDLDELPPSTALLTEHIEHRNLEIQDMSSSMVEFFIELRDRLADKTTPSTSPEREQASPVLPTRVSSKGYKMTSRSITATPKVVLEKMSTKTIENYVSPSKSSVSSRSPEVVLERVSSDEINKWLPIPHPSRKDNIEEKPKRYNTRNAIKKTLPVKKITERKGKIKSAISPIRLSFDFDSIKNANISLLHREKTGSTDLKCKTLTPLTSREVSKDISKKGSVKMDSQKSHIVDIPDIISSGKGFIQNSSCEYKSSAAGRARIETRSNKSAAENVEMNCEVLSEVNKSIDSSVNEWFKRNIATSSPSQDTNVGKEILERVMETLETTMEEIQLETGKNLASMLVENQRGLNSLREECRAVDERVVAEIMEKWAERDKRLKELMEQYQKSQKERAIEITQTHHSRSRLMVQLLREDLQAILDNFNNKNK